MKKLAVLIIAACATVLSVGQPARADWKLIVSDKGRSYYYDKNYTHPDDKNPTVLTARLMMQGDAPKYLMFSCFSRRIAFSSQEKLGYRFEGMAESNTPVGVFRDQYCKGASVDPNWQAVGENSRMQYFYDKNYVQPLENGKVFITRGSSNVSSEIDYMVLSCTSNQYLLSLNGDFSQSKPQVFKSDSFTASARNQVCGYDPELAETNRVLSGGQAASNRGNAFINSTFGHTVVH